MTNLRRDPFRSFWVAPPQTSPLASEQAGREVMANPHWERLGRLTLWPLAVLAVVHTVCVRAAAGSTTDDFTTVYLATRRFWDDIPVYNEVYHHVDPHYLYNPGATLLLSPLGLSHHPGAARMLFILVGAAAIVAALVWLCDIFGVRRSSPLLPAVIFGAFLTESVVNTLVFANINGVLLLVFVGFIAAFQHGRNWWAGVALGLLIVVKPLFAPLLVLAVMVWRWRIVAAGVAVPLTLNALAWPLVPGAGDYLSVVVPYLGEVRDYANSSILGMGAYFGWPDWTTTVLRAVVGLAVLVAMLALARWRYTDQLLWLTTSSGILLAGVFVLSSLGQQYYSMMLFPMVMTIVLPKSAVANVTSWVCLAAIFSPLDWTVSAGENLGSWVTQFANTAGWSGLIVAVAATTGVWWIHQQRKV
ncbi:glycosyltransferase family 87 protein [Corynebacterium atypicum]|uniref:glycosyltransferase family 87 protein n=1 Tax=Corynebacterium atypicum TaxID=191610 RepID=UPI0011870DAA|nr:glycosyltransferase family 87 protein [Corynebacterium atypicum]